MAKPPEQVFRQIVARPNPTGQTDKSLDGAIKFILQQQGKKKLNKADLSVVDGDEHDVNQLMRRIHGSIVAEETLTEAKTAEDTKDAANILKGDSTTSRDSLAVMTAQALSRYSFLDKADDRGMLLLIAALQLLNISNNSDTINSTARRLISAGLMQMKKK